MLTFEFEQPSHSQCPGCDGKTTRLTRFVHKDNDAYAVYYASFSDSPSHAHVSVIISLGEWGNDAPPSGRCAFYVHIRNAGDNYEVEVKDAAQSLWGKVGLLGTMLTREEALAHPWIKKVFHITDHIVAEDAPVIGYLDSHPKIRSRPHV
jgi:hypothetical protein